MKHISMKFIIFLILSTFTSFFVSAQIVKNPPQTAYKSIINPLAGEYARVDVTMGYAKGTGRVIFGNPSQSKYTPFNEFSFLIYVFGRQDIQFGKITNIRVETNNLNDYYFKFDWKNNRTDQGTISAEIQIFYSYTKNRYETYFINNSSSVFQIFWWTELNQHQKDALNSAIYSLFKKEIDKKNAEIFRQKRIDDSLQVIKNKQILEEQKRIEAINRYNDSIAFIKKRYQDSIQNIRKIENERYIKGLQIGDEYLGGIVIYKSPDSMHGLIITKKELELTYKEVFYGSINKNDHDVAFFTNNINLNKISKSELDKYLDMEILRKNLFSEYNGFKLPTLDQIKLIRDSYKNNSKIESIFSMSGNNNTRYAWICTKNNSWYFINTIANNFNFNFGLKYEMKFINYIDTHLQDPKSKAIIRLVKEY